MPGHAPVKPSAAGAVAQLKDWAERRPVLAIVSAALLATVILIGILGLYLSAYMSVSRAATGRVESMVWSPDGRRLAVSYPASIELLSWESGQCRILKTFGMKALRDMSWSPDGRRLSGYNILHNGGNFFTTLDTETGDDGVPFGDSETPILCAWNTDSDGTQRSQIAMALRDSLTVTDGTRMGVRKVDVDAISVNLGQPNAVLTTQDAAIKTGWKILRLYPNKQATLIVGRKDTKEIRILDFTPAFPHWPDSLLPGYLMNLSASIPVTSTYRDFEDMFLSPDGMILAGAEVRGDAGNAVVIDLWDIATRQKLRTLSLPREIIPGLRLSEKWSRSFATGFANGLHRMAWSRDGKRFAGAFFLETARGQNADIVLAWWDAATGNLLATKRLWLLHGPFISSAHKAREYEPPPNAISWSPNLDKAALAREIRPAFGESYLWNQSIVSIIPAPEEALPRR
jgi:WD40 repeat protein